MNIPQLSPDNFWLVVGIGIGAGLALLNNLIMHFLNIRREEKKAKREREEEAEKKRQEINDQLTSKKNPLKSPLDYILPGIHPSEKLMEAIRAAQLVINKGRESDDLYTEKDIQRIISDDPLDDEPLDDDFLRRVEDETLVLSIRIAQRVINKGREADNLYTTEDIMSDFVLHDG